MHLAVDVQVDQDHLVDAVIVPLIERRHLVDPLHLARIDVAGEDAHGPLVVELAAVAILLGDRLGAAILRRPQSRITRSVVHQVQVRIVGIPAPRRTAAPLPLIAGISADAEILAGFAVLRVLRIGLRRQPHILIAAGGEEMPRHLAVGEVVGRDRAARRELIATESDEHLVGDDDRRRRDGFTVLGIGALHHPVLLAGCGIEGNHVAVERAEHELAVCVRQSSIDSVATGARHRRLVAAAGLGIAPHLHRMIRICEIQRLHDVGPAAFHEHHRLAADILNHQRLPFVTAQRAARLRPHHLQTLHVAGVDVLEGAIAIQVEVARGGTPLVGVLEALKLLRIRCRESCTTGRDERCDGNNLDSTFCFEPLHLNSPAWV